MVHMAYKPHGFSFMANVMYLRDNSPDMENSKLHESQYPALEYLSNEELFKKR